MKKGISLIVLVITIVVMSILAGIVVINSSNIVVDTEVSKLKIDIAQLEALMDNYKLRKNGNIDFAKIEFDMAYVTAGELLQFEGENISDDNKIELYVIDLEKIDAEAVNFGNLKNGITDRYLYSLTTGKVYYEQGLEFKDTKYYYIKSGE